MRLILTYSFFILCHIGLSQYGFEKHINEVSDYRLSYSRGWKTIEYKDKFYILGTNEENKESYYNIPMPTYTPDTTRHFILCLNKKGEKEFYYETTFNSCSTYQADDHFFLIQNDAIFISGTKMNEGGYCGFYLQPPPPEIEQSVAAIKRNVFIVKLNMQGQEVWKKTYANDLEVTNRGLQTTDDGGLFLTYQKNHDSYLVKLNANGDSISSKLIINNDTYDIRHLFKTSTGYVVFSAIFGSSLNKIFFLDNSGTTLSTKTLTLGTISEMGQTKDGGYLCVGNFGSGIYMKLNASADVEWKANTSLYANEFIKETNDGNYIVGERDFAKINNTGKTIWNKNYWDFANINLFPYIFDAIQTTDGGYILTGQYTDLLNKYYTFVIKTDCNGNIEWDSNSCLFPTEQNILVFPNPFNETLTFQLPNINKDEDVVQIKITNVLGQQLFNESFSNHNIFTINTNTFSQGVYFYSIILNGKSYKSGKIIKD